MLKELRSICGPNNVLSEPSELAVYECDGLTHLRMRPSAVVLPANTQEVAQIVRLCHRHQVPFVARGAGTGLSGGALAAQGGVVIHLSRMNRILSVNLEDRLAVVEVGLVNLHLSQQLESKGFHFAPDPSSQYACTIGGNVAENSGGPHCLKYGNTTRHILGLKVVLPDGAVAELGGPRAVESGYDLVGLFVGSEGTIGIATEVTVRLSPNPLSIETRLIAFRELRQACEAVAEITRRGLVPSALEMLDQLAIQAVESSVYAAGYPEDADAVLLLELDGHPDQVKDDRKVVEEVLTQFDVLATWTAESEQERAKLWKGRKGAFGAMGKIAPDLYVLDAVVPRSQLPDVLEKVSEIGRRFGVKLCNVFHAGDGNLHPNISYDGRDAEETEKAVQAGAEIVRVCLEHGGTLSGEHGIGLEKRDFMCDVFNDDDLNVMRRVRDAFNPRGLLNPGKIFPLQKSCSEMKALSPHRIDQVLGLESGAKSPKEPGGK